MSEVCNNLDVNQIIREFETLAENADEIQREYLKNIIEQNQDSEYLQKFGLKDRTDIESFKACVPFSTHEDLDPYIQRIANGEKSNILKGTPITTFSMSSGTSNGKTKLVPITEEGIDTIIKGCQTSFAYREREYPVRGRKALQLIYSSKMIERNGIHIGQVSTNLYRHRRCKELLETIKTIPCTPYEIIFGPDFHQCLYCHLLCALIYREDIQVVISSFTHSITNAFKKFEQVWEELVDDIRSGVPSVNRITDPSIRETMSKILKPDPALADLVQEKCKELELNKWHGLMPTLFPNAKYVHAIMTGAMEPYLEKLRLYAGNVPLVCGDYGASEGWFAVNADPKLPPEQVTFTVVPNFAFFEFLPVDDGIDQQTAVGLTEVKVGHDYEVIITNHLGLYRYRLGDIVRVEGFLNSTPKLKFMRRSSVVLSVNTDKVTERDLQAVVEAGLKVLSAYNAGELVDYTSQVDRSTEPGHYIIYWEVSGHPSDEVLMECCNAIDVGFADMGYISSRRAKVIGPLELRVLKKETISKLVDNFSSMGLAANQFKMPRYITATHIKLFEILSEGVDKTFFSTAF